MLLNSESTNVRDTGVIEEIGGQWRIILNRNFWRLDHVLQVAAIVNLDVLFIRIISEVHQKNVSQRIVVGPLRRRHIVAGEFRYIGKEASTRWAGGVDLSMLPAAGALDPADETCREYERVVDPKYLDQIRAQAKQFSTKRLSRQSKVAECAIRNFKNGRNTIKPRSLRKLTRAIHDLQNRSIKN